MSLPTRFFRKIKFPIELDWLAFRSKTCWSKQGTEDSAMTNTDVALPPGAQGPAGVRPWHNFIWPHATGTLHVTRQPRAPCHSLARNLPSKRPMSFTTYISSWDRFSSHITPKGRVHSTVRYFEGETTFTESLLQHVVISVTMLSFVINVIAYCYLFYYSFWLFTSYCTWFINQTVSQVYAHRKNRAYIGFWTPHGFRHPLGVSECIPHRQGRLLWSGTACGNGM